MQRGLLDDGVRVRLGHASLQQALMNIVHLVSEIVVSGLLDLFALAEDVRGIDGLENLCAGCILTCLLLEEVVCHADALVGAHERAGDFAQHFRAEVQRGSPGAGLLLSLPCSLPCGS